MDVLTTAWTASGEPLVTVASTRGTCSRCGGRDVDLTPTRHVVSGVFTGFDGWINASGAGLCAGCSWGYRTPRLRAVAHLVLTDPPRLLELTSTQVGELLDRPLPTDAALVVPLRPGRKHLLPTAVWGRVTVDDAQLPWTAADCARLAAMRRLRARGFGSRMLAAPAPTWPVLRKLPRHWWHDVELDWALLAPWRSRRPWFDLAVQATVPAPVAAA